MRIGSYELLTPMNNQNSGFSVWGFAAKNGREYFIKEFLSPKYPDQDDVSSMERQMRRIRQCRHFEEQKTALYRAVNQGSDGNAVRILDFFRQGSGYYIVTDRVWETPLTPEQISCLPQPEIRRLCAIIAHTMAGLHREGVVHGDLKPTNILFTTTPAGLRTAKVIDFDSSFLESDPPAPGDDIVGDAVYFSPEACMSMWEEKVALTCKMDVFAMGILFHQYLTGELPDFDREASGSAGEAVAKGLAVTVSQKLQPDTAELIRSMLAPDPAVRPGAEDVFLALCPRSLGTAVDPTTWLQEACFSPTDVIG